MTMMVQSGRASLLPTKDPLPLETSWELYFMMILLAIGAVAAWEGLWGSWYYLSGQESPAELRKSRRLKKMQEAVQQEIASQLATASSSAPVTPARPTPAHEEQAAASTTPRRRSRPIPGLTTSPTSTDLPMPRLPAMSTAARRGKTVYRADQCDKATQLDAAPLIQYQDREVPVVVPEPTGWTRPIWVSEHGDCFHTLDHCWGLRNVRKTRRLLFCTMCRDNHGRNLYPERSARRSG